MADESWSRFRLMMEQQIERGHVRDHQQWHVDDRDQVRGAQLPGDGGKAGHDGVVVVENEVDHADDIEGDDEQPEERRERYARVGNKQDMLIACISARARRLDLSADFPIVDDRETLAQALAAFGAKLVREVSDPAVVAVFRLAIAEAVRAPEVAEALQSTGRRAARAALRTILAGARAAGLLTGRPAELAEQFSGLLWGDLMINLLLGVSQRPSPRDIAPRAHEAAAAFLRLHPLPMAR
jgi:hypothetical protein